MTDVVFSPKLMEALHFLSNNLTEEKTFTKSIPAVNSLGEPIAEVKSLAHAMGVDLKIAAAYALESKNPELKADAIEVLAPGVYNAFEDAYEAISHFAYEITQKNLDKVEVKRVRMVRSTSGVRKFGQRLGSIIVSDGEAPLDGLVAQRGDVPGYSKVNDKRGNTYYIGMEGNKWVVRSGQSKAVIFESNDTHSGQVAALRWLNGRVGGSRSPSEDKPKKKSIEEDIEEKAKRKPAAVDRLGKEHHAFRNSNGDYSYPIANVADLKNAIQAFGRAAEADREKLKSYIKGRARALKRPDLIPDNWKTGEPDDIEAKYDTSPLDRSPGKNWVELSGKLPSFIRAIAHALIRDHGFTTSRAIATAVNRVKKWSVDPKVSAKTRAKAVKAVAEWEKLKASNKVRVAANRAKKG